MSKTDVNTSIKVEDVEENENENENIVEKELIDGLVDFDIPDTTQTTKENNKTNYTVIDNLDEDELPDGCPKYYLVSFVSPEGIMNCNLRALKIRAAFNTKEECEKAAARLRKKDKYFDIYMGEFGKWVPWDQDPMTVEDGRYGNKKQNEIMKRVHKSSAETEKLLNELVGKKKESIDKSKITHKERVAGSIKTSLNEQTNIEQEKTEMKTMNVNKPNNNKTKNINVKHGAQGKQEIIERLRRKQQEKQKNIEEHKILEKTKYPQPQSNKIEQISQTLNTEQMKQGKEKIIEEHNRINEKETSVKELELKKEKINDNINKLKQMLFEQQKNEEKQS